jgi:hypothetical protein
LAFPDSSNNEQTPHARREGKAKTKQKLHRREIQIQTILNDSRATATTSFLGVS